MAVVLTSTTMAVVLTSTTMTITMTTTLMITINNLSEKLIHIKTKFLAKYGEGLNDGDGIDNDNDDDDYGGDDHRKSLASVLNSP